jgi:glycosyltransferase involved in cell wall biosynthesis
MPGILIFFHNPSNSGFASMRHEITFARMAYRLVGDYNNIHFAYTSLSQGRSASLPEEITNIIEFDSSTRDPEKLTAISDYIQQHNIRVGFGFDQHVRCPAHKYLRKAGMRYLISYIGAPMSSINRGMKLLVKKIDVACSRHQPDHYIFQSEGMRKTATHGRGIPLRSTSVVLSGADTELYKPSVLTDWYAHDTFGIARNRKIVFFSGNMEERKGVDVIVRTAAELVNNRHRSDVHFLLVGNRWGQEKRLAEIVRNTIADGHITFGGYRNDVPRILASCYIGMIASTGWDSYPMSAVEMAASGMPIIVSDLPGLRETITKDTGFLFQAGNHQAAADIVTQLLDDSLLRENMGSAARSRVLRYQTVEHQVIGLEMVVRAVAGDVFD